MRYTLKQPRSNLRLFQRRDGDAPLRNENAKSSLDAEKQLNEVKRSQNAL